MQLIIKGTEGGCEVSRFCCRVVVSVVKVLPLERRFVRRNRKAEKGKVRRKGRGRDEGQGGNCVGASSILLFGSSLLSLSQPPLEPR